MATPILPNGLAAGTPVGGVIGLADAIPNGFAIIGLAAIGLVGTAGAILGGGT